MNQFEIHLGQMFIFLSKCSILFSEYLKLNLRGAECQTQ